MNDQITIFDLLGALWRRKLTLIFTFALMMLFTVLACLAARSKFQSQSKLFVRVGRESIGLDPTATITGQVLGVNVERETEINSVAELVRSRNVLESAVDEIGVAEVLQVPKPGPMTPVTDAITNAKKKIKQLLSSGEAAVDQATADREEAIEILAESTSVTVPKASSVVTISAKAYSPALAQKIASTVTYRYLDAHAKSSRPNGSLEFFSEQTATLKKKVTDLRNKLAKQRVDDGIVSLDTQLESMGRHKAQLEGGLLEAQAKREASLAKLSMIESASKKISDKVVLQEIHRGQSAPSTEMRSQLFQLEMKASQLNSGLSPDHPSLQAVSSQLDTAREILDAQENAESAATTTGINPAWQQLQLNLLNERVALAASESSLQTITNQLNELKEKVSHFNRRAQEYQNINREIQLADTSYRRYAESLERSRIDEALQNNHITNVSVAQDATLVRKPVFPDKKTMLAIGTLFAGLFSVAIALARDFLDQSIRTPEEVEQIVGMPVIATIPKSDNALITATSGRTREKKKVERSSAEYRKQEVG